MKQVTQYILSCKSLSWIFPMLFGVLLSLPIERTLEAAVEGGALVKGSAFSDGTTVVPAHNATSKAIKWSQLDYDTTVFDFNSSTPTRLKVKSAGDYFLSFTGPVAEASRAANARSQVHFFVKKNGSTAIPTAKTSSTYVRHDSDHTESSGHLHILLPSLSTNDYVEVYAKAFDTSANTLSLGTTSLFLEKVASSRTIFSGTAVRTVSSTNLNEVNPSALQWTQEIADSGFTHSNTSNSHNITLDAAGAYL
ncbi:MAG: hypothetical protein HN754_02930, partial [Opitutae bacterium]|nr:hypothetical protein [Opitutae bacterium]